MRYRGVLLPFAVDEIENLDVYDFVSVHDDAWHQQPDAIGSNALRRKEQLRNRVVYGSRMSSRREAQSYWCHQCQRTIRIDAREEGLVCPNCNEGFVEEAERSPQNVGYHPYPFGRGQGQGQEQEQRGLRFEPWLSGSGPAGGRSTTLTNDHGVTQMMDSLAAFFQDGTDADNNNNNNNTNDEEQIERGGRVRMWMDPGGFNPMMFLQGQLMQNLMGAGGGNVEIFVDDRTGAGPTRLPGNVGDYFLGPGLDQLIQQLAENDPNRYGTPPASKTSIGTMPTIKITQDLLVTDSTQCAVCKDEFEVGTEVRQMPCKHMYHSGCILPWLEQHNSCPVCRYEMPTDDVEYEQARSRGQSSLWVRNSGGTPDGQGGNPDGFSSRGVLGTSNNSNNESLGLEMSSGNTMPGTSSIAPNQQAASGGGGAVMFPVHEAANVNGSGRGTSRHFQVSLAGPFRASFSTTQQAQAETSSGPANSGETVSSRPDEGNDVQGNNLATARAEDDGDTLMSEAREGDLD